MHIFIPHAVLILLATVSSNTEEREITVYIYKYYLWAGWKDFKKNPDDDYSIMKVPVCGANTPYLGRG